MSEHDPVQQNPGAAEHSSLRCGLWESLLPEALDGTISPVVFPAFEEHAQGCAACGRMFKEARQGMDWLNFLREPPEVPAGLFDKILAQTSGTQQAALLARRQAPERMAQVEVLGLAARRVLESRYLRTAAMAFFSLALTLNLIGVKFSVVRLSELSPAMLLANLSRQYYSANEQVVRYYENLRFIYEMETRVRDFQRSAEPEPAPEPAKEQPSPTSYNGIRRVPNAPSAGRLRAGHQPSSGVEEGLISDVFGRGRSPHLAEPEGQEERKRA